MRIGFIYLKTGYTHAHKEVRVKMTILPRQTKNTDFGNTTKPTIFHFFSLIHHAAARNKMYQQILSLFNVLIIENCTEQIS